jgi:hypothetical protein
MLWRAMLRGTAVGLLTAAAQAAGAMVQSSKDTPAPADSLPWLAVYVDDKKHGDSGAEPRFRTIGTVTIEIRAQGASQGAAEAQLDLLCELVETTLLGTQGQSLVGTCTDQSPLVTLPSVAGLSVGMKLMGPGLPDVDVAIAAIDTQKNLLTLTAPWSRPGSLAKGDSYAVRFNIGSFVALFEQIDQVETFTQYDGKENRLHLASATVEIIGHTSERFEPSFTTCLKGLDLYIEFPPGTTMIDATVDLPDC